MSIITDSADLKTLVPNVHQQTSDGNVMPYIEDAACVYLEPVISSELYEQLVTETEADSLTAANLKIIKHLRKALGYFTLYDLMPFQNVKVSNAGIATNQAQNGHFTGVRQWEKNETKAAAITKADKFLDKALTIMLSNPDDYPLWKNSEVYSVSFDLLIPTSEEFSSISQKITRRTFLFLVPFMRTAEHKYIRSAIGIELLSGLKDRIINDTLTANDVIILPLIKKALAYYTLYTGASSLKLDFSTEGIRLVSTSDGISSSTPAGKDYHEWRKERYHDGENFLGELKNYLEKNYEDFPEYESSTAKNNNTPRTTLRNNSNSKSSVML